MKALERLQRKEASVTDFHVLIPMLLQLVDVANEYFDVTDDRHECPRNGTECPGCSLKDVLNRLESVE